MRTLIILLFISFSGFSQTKELDELKRIWINESFELGFIKINNGIDWDANFVPYSINRENAIKEENYYTKLLTKIGLKTGTYNISSSTRSGTGRYWIDIERQPFYSFIIYDTYNNNETVAYLDKSAFYTKSFHLFYNKAYFKYLKKNKVDPLKRMNPSDIIWGEILKRYRR